MVCFLGCCLMDCDQAVRNQSSGVQTCAALDSCLSTMIEGSLLSCFDNRLWPMMMQHEKGACWWPLEQPRYISFIIVTMSCYIIAISGQLASVISKRRFLFNHTNVFSRFWSFLVETDRAIWLFSYDVRSIDSYNYLASCNTENAFNKVKRTLNGISCLVCIFYEKNER